MIYICWKGQEGGVNRFVGDLSHVFKEVKIHYLAKNEKKKLRHLLRIFEMAKLPINETIITQGPLIYLYCKIALRRKVYCHIHNRSKYDTFIVRAATILARKMNANFIYASNNLRTIDGKIDDLVLFPIVAVPTVKPKSKNTGGALVSARNHPDKNLLTLSQSWEAANSKAQTQHKLRMLTDDNTLIEKLNIFKHVKCTRYSKLKNVESFRTASIYISSSVYEAFGLSIADAVFSQVPVLLLKGSGEMFEVFSNEFDEAEFSASTVSGLTEKAIALLDDDRTRIKLAEGQLRCLERHIEFSKKTWSNFICRC